MYTASLRWFGYLLSIANFFILHLVMEDLVFILVCQTT